jgi:hypothetical protein
LYWKTQDLSPVIMQLRKCELHSQACVKWLQVATLCSSCRETVWNKFTLTSLFPKASRRIWQIISQLICSWCGAWEVLVDLVT